MYRMNLKSLFVFLVMIAALGACSEKKTPEQQGGVPELGADKKQAVADENSKAESPHAAMQAKPESHAAPQADEERKKQIAAMEAQLREEVKQNPDSAKAHSQLASFLLAQNKTEAAIPAYQDAITHDPENPKLFAGLSIAYLHQSKFNMAKAMADQALQLNPEMESVKKINEYISTKKQVMEQAQQADAAATAGMQKPDDALHKMIDTNKGVVPHSVAPAAAQEGK